MRTPIIATVVLAGLAVAAPAQAAGFSAGITNPYFPAKPGMRWVYTGVKDGRRLHDVVLVTGRVRRIDGVPCAVISDRTWLDGRLAERTTDWYTQDAHGTVWYYGERTAELDRHGRVKSRSGSWRAGRDGARGGIFMPAHPRIGSSFAQEHYPGHAEDHFRIVSRRATVRVPYGTFRHALRTREWTPLEPGVRDGKWYVRGIGEVREAALKGPVERAELVSFTR